MISPECPTWPAKVSVSPISRVGGSQTVRPKADPLHYHDTVSLSPERAKLSNTNYLIKLLSNKSEHDDIIIQNESERFTSRSNR